ncbi:MAG: rRNA maturation RNase YbeY [Candidatus Falkowbacteria bacterium]|nr:rRNA maturation RNase YbeY [Candidatus Falkowbacteria bacterium]
MIEICNKTKFTLDIALIKKITSFFLKKYKIKGKDVSIAIIARINFQYRKKDKSTDVLSFRGEDNFLGEILIDAAQIKRQAKKNKNTFKDEFIFILVHGLLHLAGFDDKTEAQSKIMHKLGMDFIKKL